MNIIDVEKTAEIFRKLSELEKEKKKAYEEADKTGSLIDENLAHEKGKELEKFIDENREIIFAGKV